MSDEYEPGRSEVVHMSARLRSVNVRLPSEKPFLDLYAEEACRAVHAARIEAAAAERKRCVDMLNRMANDAAILRDSARDNMDAVVAYAIEAATLSRAATSIRALPDGGK